MIIFHKIRHSIILILILLLIAVNAWLAIRIPVSAVGETLTIDAPVVFSAGYSISSAQFIDNANSAYFLDPSATGNSLLVAGNVGIGTTGPGAKLEVGATASQYLRLNPGYGSPHIKMKDGTDSNSPPAFINGGYAYQGVSLTTNSYFSPDAGTWQTPESSTAPSWATIMNSCGVGICGANGDHFEISRAPATAGTPSFSQLMYINSNGNVGIGTAAPTEKLTIANSSPSSATYADKRLDFYTRRAGGGLSGDLLGQIRFLSTRADQDSGYPGPAIGAVLEGNVSSYTVPSSLVFFNCNGCGDGLSVGNQGEVMRIKSNGNVGIGTAAPVSRLDLNGGSIAMGPLNATGAINFRNDIAVGTAGSVGIGAIDAASQGNNDGLGLYVSDGLKILNGSTAYFTLLTASGNVGIGTTSPSTALQVVGTITGTTKNFEINHPTKPGMKLIHSTLEGPEVAVFYRGEARLTNGQATIKLPGYFEALTRVEGRTVQLTAKNGWSPLYVGGDVIHGKFTVKEDSGNPSQQFFWEVKAVRADIPLLQVEKSVN